MLPAIFIKALRGHLYPTDPRGMKIDLLIAKPQRGAPRAEGDHLHAEMAIERAGRVEIANGEHEMIEMVDGHERI